VDIEPDTKDWTWVLEAACPECGLNASDVPPTEIAHRVQAELPRWSAVLERPDARERPAPTTWSPTEYACHVRDVHTLFGQRIRLMLEQDGPQFPNWDQDETAIADDYASQDPTTVAAQLVDAGEGMIELLKSIPDGAWGRTGYRSDGSEFTIGTLTQYYLHDIAHHLHDVRG
jgi:hypothetical protein